MTKFELFQIDRSLEAIKAHTAHIEAVISGQIAPPKWLDWAGGECPVPPGTITYLRFASTGPFDPPTRTTRPESMSWGRVGSRGDIVAFCVADTDDKRQFLEFARIAEALEWPDDDGTGKAGESRIDRIAASHGDGEHYACPEI